MFNSKIVLVLIFLFSLPILLFVYQPSMRLGGFGLFLGAIGMTVSPLILFGVLVTFIYKKWTEQW